MKIIGFEVSWEKKLVKYIRIWGIRNKSYNPLQNPDTHQFIRFFMKGMTIVFEDYYLTNIGIIKLISLRFPVKH